jgi:hypothetical protein
MRHQTTITIEPFVEILAPTSRLPGMYHEDDLYGPLIGSWELDLVAYPDDGNTTRSTGEAHFAWVLEGRAIQDVFINPQLSDRTPNSPKFGNWYGTTFRFFDPTIRAWRVFWFNPDDGVRAELVGRRSGNDIVQEGHFPDGTPIRWTFSEITPDTCHWRGERLEPNGKTWRLQVEFHAQRIGTEVCEVKLPLLHRRIDEHP